MEYILETENLTKTYGKKTALNNVSIHVNQGDIYGLVGRNGAGKTTLFQCRKARWQRHLNIRKKRHRAWRCCTEKRIAHRITGIFWGV